MIEWFARGLTCVFCSFVGVGIFFCMILVII